MNSNKVKFMEMKSLATGSVLPGAWTQIGSAFEGALGYVLIVNDTDSDVKISFDGSTEHLYVRTDNSVDIYFQQISTPGNHVSKLAKYTKVYAKGATGQSGSIYVSGCYQE